MSIYFSIQDDPMIVEQDPEYGELRSHAWEVLNVSNMNGVLIIRALGLTDDCMGEILLEEIPAVIQKAVRILNVEKDQAQYTRPDEEVPDRFYSRGVDEAKVRDYMTRILAVLRGAQKRKKNVVWS